MNELAKLIVDKLLDVVEDFIVSSETSWDDTLVLPLLKQLRDALDIPDND